MPIDRATWDFLRGEWYAAGGPEEHADVAAAIAFAESTGCQYALAGPTDIRPVKTCAFHRTNGENSCGYWQINLWAHPQYRAPSIFGVAENAAAAVAISDHGRSFHAWSTYTNGAYEPYLAEFGGGGPPPPPPPPSPGGHLEPGNMSAFSGWEHFTKAAGRDLPAALNHARRYRESALQLLRSSRKVR